MCQGSTHSAPLKLIQTSEHCDPAEQRRGTYGRTSDSNPIVAEAKRPSLVLKSDANELKELKGTRTGTLLKMEFNQSIIREDYFMDILMPCMWIEKGHIRR